MKSKKSPIEKNIQVMDKKRKSKSPKKKAFVPVSPRSKMFKGKLNYSVTKSRSPKIKRVKFESKSILNDLQMGSFIDCIHFIKTNLDTYDNGSGDKLICDIYFIIEPRINVPDDDPLINTSKLYENVVNYAKTYWSKENIQLMKQLINDYKTHKYYTIVKKFLNEL
jgi:hypothetical protein